MAPILTTATGILLHPLSERLQQLLEDFQHVNADTVEGLLIAAENCFSEEQIDLHQWIEPINKLDQILRACLEQHPQILLLPPVPRVSKMGKPLEIKPAQSLAEAESVPAEIIQRILAILNFWETMLRNASGKTVFNSVEECCDLLASGNDEIVDAALSVLQALSLPPALHKQQAPEIHGHSTALQNAHQACLSRVTVLARGYTSRSTGLGLYQLLTTKQSVRSVHFSYIFRCEENSADTIEDEIMKEEDKGSPQEIVLLESDIVDERASVLKGKATKKRRRVGVPSAARIGTDDEVLQPTRSTSELFFMARSKLKGRIEPERLFSLLSDIRWARSTNLSAVNRRLSALVCILHSHPSQEVMTGYLMAQPDIAVELVELLRPTVSSNAASSAAAAQYATEWNHLQQDGITWLADTQEIPHRTRIMALETLTALVTRKDGSTGALSGSTRLSSVLAELGVGKGQYLGVLPTLIRYSLASLGNAMMGVESGERRPTKGSADSGDISPTTSLGLQLGLAFVEATLPPQPTRFEQVKQALEVIDSVLTLTSAVIAIPSGASSLIECGMIPALLTTTALDTEKTYQNIMRGYSEVSPTEKRYIDAMLRYVAAQAVQIVEGAVVTSSSALTAFHDLNGVDVLTNRLTHEVFKISGDEPMEVESDEQGLINEESLRELATATIVPPSKRVLLFSIFTCLTVVFHQESSSTTVTISSGASQLKKKEVTNAIIRILDGVSAFGGHLVSLVATLLADIMNNDPLLVHYIHESGIAASFLRLIAGKKDGESFFPTIPPVAELLMAIPNVLAALALTEDGASAVKRAAPFPALMKVFYHPDYAMPNSRCLLNEMTSVVGTGLDEIMRHVDQLKTDVILAITESVSDVLKLSDDLAARESLVRDGHHGCTDPHRRRSLETERTCLIQYVLNFSQILEQVLHSHEHCEPFVTAGGLELLLKLYAASMPSGAQLLNHLSTLSSISVSSLHHATIEDCLSLAIRSIQFRTDPLKVIQMVITATRDYLDVFEVARRALFRDSLYFSLDEIEGLPCYKFIATNDDQSITELANFLKCMVVVQWHTTILSNSIKALCQRGQESGSDAWEANERAWKKELLSPAFTETFDRLATIFHSSFFEVCRLRAEDNFDTSEYERLVSRDTNLRYRLRIVCPEGAVVRDGIEIDSCSSIGSMEMGEIITAYDRCINSSGIMRWRTDRGWISEMTRGHGREPIAEVIEVTENAEDDQAFSIPHNGSFRRVEAGIPDLRIVTLGLYARGQSSYAQILSEISKLSMQVLRSVPARTMSFAEETAANFVASLLQTLSNSIIKGLNIEPVRRNVLFDFSDGLADEAVEKRISPSGVSMYISSLINQAQQCLFEDRRERRIVNFPLLLALFGSDPFVKALVKNESEPSFENLPFLPKSTTDSGEMIGLWRASCFVFRQCMLTLSKHVGLEVKCGRAEVRKINRGVAASFPLIMSFLRRLITTPLSSSPVASVMSRMKLTDIPRLIGKPEIESLVSSSPNNDGFFEPEQFVRLLHLASSRLLKIAWQDPNLVYVPAHLMYPFANLIGEALFELVEGTKEKPKALSRFPRNENGFSLSDYLRQRRERDEAEIPDEEEDFVPDENAIALLVDMGFSRDRAIDAVEATQSNRVEVAMEYALTHPPPSPETIERRRLEREGRRNRRSRSTDNATTEESPVASSGAANQVAHETGLQETESAAAESKTMEIETSETQRTSEHPLAEEDSRVLWQDEIASWLKIVPEVVCNLFTRTDSQEEEGAKFDCGRESLVIVLTAFVLQLSLHYPLVQWYNQQQSRLSPTRSGNMRSPNVFGFASILFERMKKEISADGSIERAPAFAAICHGTVLVLRSVPKSRVLLLKENLLASLVVSVKKVCSEQQATANLPVWLAPAILVLEVMAQPVVGFTNGAFLKEVLDDDIVPETGDLSQVIEEHKLYSRQIEGLTLDLFSSTCSENRSVPVSRSEQDASSSDMNRMKAQADAKELKINESDSPGTECTIPTFYPLMPTESLEICLGFCMNLIGVGSPLESRIQLSPDTAQAVLSLLHRILRTPEAAEKCRQNGAVNCILTLPSNCKFSENASLVALVLRRLVEDEATLQAAMEAEMKMVLSKLQSKRTGGTDEERPGVLLKSFLDATMPLMSRNPLLFLKALSLSVRIVTDSASMKRKDGAVVAKDAIVVPLAPGERAKHRNLLRINMDSNQNHRSCLAPRKSPRARSSIGRKGAPMMSETPAMQVMSSLINFAVYLYCQSLDEAVTDPVKTQPVLRPQKQVLTDPIKDEFLWFGDILNVMAELILAVPACSNALHNYRSSRTREIRTGEVNARNSWVSLHVPHALLGSSNPPKNFVNFLLHCVLPQDRFSIQNDPDIWDKVKGRAETEVIKKKKRRAYRLVKASQGAARVLLALAMRTGESRKRVINELTFALSGGRLGHGFGSMLISPETHDVMLVEQELFAFQAWGELVLGLLAPRSIVQNADGNGSTFSIESIRHMLDVGTVHALMFALHRVKLFHPFASSVLTSLLRPLECLTRVSVSSSVSALVEKDVNTPDDEVQTCTRVDSTADAAALNDTTAQPDVEMGAVDMGADAGEDEIMGSSSSSSGIESDEEESEPSASSAGESISSSFDSIDEEDEEDDDEMDSVEDEDVGEAVDEGDWDDEDQRDLEEREEDNEEVDFMEEDIDPVDQSFDEGWTRIDSSSFGGTAGRRGLTSFGNSDRSRMRGFVDAAEAMIGSLLRHGEISSEAMDEIGETLGIHLNHGQFHSMQNGDLRLASASTQPGRRAMRVLGDADTSGDDSVVLLLPRIQQRSLPDTSYSSFSGQGRGSDYGSMEFVFGGPTVTLGHRNFALSSNSDPSEAMVDVVLNQQDVHLFPNGPSSALTSRLRQPLHRLLRGLDLPPMSSFVIDYSKNAGQNERSESSPNRRTGEWVSTSGGLIMSLTTGSIVRSSSRAPNNGLGVENLARSLRVGLAEDATAIDSAVRSYTESFERVLTERARSSAQAVQALETGRHASTAPAELNNAENSTNDGDVVASSLAEGLRLSPGGAENSNQDADIEGQGDSEESFMEESLSNAQDDVRDRPADENNHSNNTHSLATTNATDDAAPESNEEVVARNEETDENQLVCPPNVDADVFNSLPLDMQRECVSQYNSAQELADQLVGSSLDPDVLAALPEDVRREVMEQDRQERQRRSQATAAADPSNAEDMDNASFIASLVPELREEILATADETFLNSLHPSIIAEAQLLRERASVQQHLFNDRGVGEDEGRESEHRPQHAEAFSTVKRSKRLGKLKVENDKDGVIYRPEQLPSPFGKSDVILLIRLMFSNKPVRPSRLLQKVFLNMFADPVLRTAASAAFIRLLHADRKGCRRAIDAVAEKYCGEDWRSQMDSLFKDPEFPYLRLLRVATDVSDLNSGPVVSHRKIWPSASAALAAHLPKFTGTLETLHPVVATRLMDTMVQLSKASPRYCVHLLTVSGQDNTTGFEQLLDLLGKSMFMQSSTNLDQLLSLLEAAVVPLSHLPRVNDELGELSPKELTAAATAGKHWIDVPRIAVSKSRLQLLCSILRMEVCRDSSFTKVNTIVRRLCRVDINRTIVLGELAAVARALGVDARRDLQALKTRMESAAGHHQSQLQSSRGTETMAPVPVKAGHLASSVTLSTSSSELKLLRVLQTLQSLCVENVDDSSNRKNDSIVVTEELALLFQQLEFEELWDELSSCLGFVQVLEGVRAFEVEQKSISEDSDSAEEAGDDGADEQQPKQQKKLRNSAAGLLNRFLPSIEAFFVATASAMKEKSDNTAEESSQKRANEIAINSLIDGKRLISFVSTNKVLLNALVRNNSSLIDKGLRALVQVGRCRPYLDFDVKRQWFKSQLRRLRQQAARRHGSLRLHIRRKYVFEDAYHQLRLRNAEEMRGRLHVTFRNEAGVDAGGLSREFFGILAKEIFNPNYALFTSTEDGCTFQPNPNSSINPDHLSYFRFVGRIVGKAVADGFLLDAHFTRSLYKHMLGLTPTYHDMEAIDPDYYRNLKAILEYNLADIGLDLTFSIEDHSFGRSQTIDLIPNGRSTHVTDENKEEYVRLVCQHRMTTAIQSQIKAYLDGFYEMVNPDHIVIFTPRELELLISGLPDIDVTDLKSNTDYAGWKSTDKEIVWFWNILFSLSRNEKAAFLQFVTGSSKVPLSGFGELQGMRGVQKFSIHKVSGKKGALMSAHTCFNQLDLPNYDSEEEMRTKLLLAINEGGGAFLFA